MCNKEKIKRIIQNSIGVNCSVVSKQGRKKFLIEDCIIEAAYPEIFVVRFNEKKTNRIKKLTFSYIDVLIKNVIFVEIGNSNNEIRA